MIKRYWKKGKKQKARLIFTALLLTVVLFVLRDDYQPALLFVRKYIFIELLALIILFFSVRRFRNATGTGKRIGTFFMVFVVFAIIYFVGWHFEMYGFMQKYNVYKNLNLEEIHELPITQNERIQPFNNIVTMAYESISETEEISLPQLVKVDGNNNWTMAVQPAKEYMWQRINDNTEEVFSVSSTSPFPRFSGENRVEVTFNIGESLAFSRHTYSAAIQKFNIFQFFMLEPGDVFYMKNDVGKWVQVVSLIKWKGFFFPYPTFGGVMVIDSGKHNFMDYLERIFLGKGKYISAKDLQNNTFLKGQNTLSEKISRLQAESLMFLGGFTDPLPWNMETAVKIPVLEEDQNQLPFVTDFDFAGVKPAGYTGLYHWFGLEPIGEERTSLAFSVFVPADGTDKMIYYNHSAKKEGKAGISAMPLKVIESRKEYDWSVSYPVEFRPYIREIAGRKRMFVLSTIASKRSESKKFDGSATPDLALIDVEYRDVVWVDVKHPSVWDQTLYNSLYEVWAASENLKLEKQITVSQDSATVD